MSADTRARLPQQLERRRVAHLDAGLGEHPAGRVVHPCGRPRRPRPAARRAARVPPARRPRRGRSERRRRSRLALPAGGPHDLGRRVRRTAGSSTKARAARSSATRALTRSSMVGRPAASQRSKTAWSKRSSYQKSRAWRRVYLRARKLPPGPTSRDLVEGERLVVGGHVAHEGLGPADRRHCRRRSIRTSSAGPTRGSRRRAPACPRPRPPDMAVRPYSRANCSSIVLASDMAA